MSSPDKGERHAGLTILDILYEERIGGPQLRTLQVARGLQERGIETIIVIPKGDPTFASLLTEAQIPYRETELVRLRHTFNPAVHARFLVRFWPNVAALRRLIREHHVDIVHTNGLMNTQAAIAARLEGVPLAWHIMDLETPWPLRFVLLRLVRRWADCVSISAKAVGEAFFPDRSVLRGRLGVTYAPVDVRKFAPQVDRSGVRAEFGIAEDCAVVGTVANVCPGKGYEYLLEAAPQIKQRYPATKFLLVGAMLENRRSYWTTLQRRVQELGLANDVIFTGRRMDMPQVMRAMTVYVHPSESEGCGMAILEASASGLPVVATNVGGPRETVEEGVTGLLIEPKRPAQIADAVIRLLDSPETARRMGLAGVERMARIFSLDAAVEAHVQTYAAALGRPTPSPAKEPTPAPVSKAIQHEYSRD